MSKVEDYLEKNVKGILSPFVRDALILKYYLKVIV